jgi:glycolate oxidase iron-sulfur subunit
MTLSTQEFIAEADRCVTCGLCLPHCPTYHKTGSEADSPRGRIQLMSAVARDIIPNNNRFKAHIDLCLSCRNCETACPNGVKYGALIDTARNMTPQHSTWVQSLSTKIISTPKLLNIAVYFLQQAQHLGLLNIAEKLNKSLKKRIALLPKLSKHVVWRDYYPPTHSQQGEVSLFLGCISNAFDIETLRASIFVLNQLGYGVHIPKTQTCCGGLARQQGDSLTSQSLIQQNIDAFRADLPLLTIASGCGAGLKDYTSMHVKDISDFLNQCNWQHITLAPLKKHIAVHDPCTLRNVLKSHQAVYDLLKKIPSAQISSLNGNAQCCGGAGVYMLNQPTMAQSLLKDKLSSIQTANCDILATSNIGCALHMGSGIKSSNLTTQVLHPMIILAKQMGFSSTFKINSRHAD